MQRGKAVFLGDGFRTHSMLRAGRPHEPAARFAKLLAPILRSLGYRIETIAQFRAGPAADLYRTMFGLEENAFTWAYRSQVLTSRLEAFYDVLLRDAALVIGFELPESAYLYCTQRDIPVVDAGFHFVRFEADYILKVRSSSPRLTEAFRAIRSKVNRADVLAKQTGDLDLFDGFDTEAEISVFIMQTRFDRAKFDGTGFVDDVRIVEAREVAVDYYKPHPHEPRPELELALRRNGARPFPAAYGAYPFVLDHGHHARLVTVSSGLVAEADIIGAHRTEYLVGFPWVVDGFEAYSSAGWTYRDVYVPVDKRIFGHDFWRSVLDGAADAAGAGVAPDFSVKEYWNVAWS